MNNQGTSSSTQLPDSESSTRVAGELLSSQARLATDFNEKANALSQAVERLETRVTKTESEVVVSQSQNIQSLGLFVALFTFISIEFALFKEVKSLSAAIALTFIISGILVLFVFLLHIIINNTRRSEDNRTIVMEVIMFFSIIILLGLGLFNSKYFTENDIQIRPTLAPTPTVFPTKILPSP